MKTNNIVPMEPAKVESDGDDRYYVKFPDGTCWCYYRRWVDANKIAVNYNESMNQLWALHMNLKGKQ